MKLRTKLSIFFLIITCSARAQTPENFKINGLSLVSEQFYLDSTHIEPIVDVCANFAAVIPYSFMPLKDSSAVIFGSNNQWKGEGVSGTRIAVNALQDKNIQTMIKPQIWVGHGIFTGEIEMKNEDEWVHFEENYSTYILAFAKIAEEENVNLFCIGTEMKMVVEKRPELFPRLIHKVREVYSGRITYAENWDCFDQVKFWDKLDFIGVDAYFPLSNSRNPSVNKLKKKWTEYLPVFDSLYTKYDKKILFTEFGYRSIKKCTRAPWKYQRSEEHVISERCQAKALKALFETVWDREYFVGGFLWKWHPDNENAGGSENSMFTVQNKEAQEVVRRKFSFYTGWVNSL